MWWKILLIIFALFILFFFQSIHVSISYTDEFKLVAGLGFIRVNVLNLIDKFKNKPEKEDEEKKEKKPKKEKPKKEAKQEEEQPEIEKTNVFKEVIELRGVDGAVDLLSEFSSLLSKFGGGLAKHFVIRQLYVRFAVSGKDSADVAEKFGKMNALVFSSLGIMSSACNVKRHDIVITPDFLGQVDKQEVKIHFSYRLASLIFVALRALKDFLAILKREKSINAKIKARSRAKALARERQEYLEEMKQSQTQEG